MIRMGVISLSTTKTKKLAHILNSQAVSKSSVNSNNRTGHAEQCKSNASARYTILEVRFEMLCYQPDKTERQRNNRLR